MAQPANEYEELLELETILIDGFAGLDGYEGVQISIDLDYEFDLLDDNEESTPVVLLEVDETMNTKAGSKGNMLAGYTNIDISIIVAKGTREFAVYYKEIVELAKQVRIIFQNYLNKRVEFVRQIFVNQYAVGDYKAIGIGITVRVPSGNYDLTIN
jgi:hypothetical protein